MNHRLKQRLVGTGIFAVIVAVCLPVLFHSSNPIQQARLSSVIPPKPATPNRPNQVLADQSKSILTIAPVNQVNQVNTSASTDASSPNTTVLTHSVRQQGVSVAHLSAKTIAKSSHLPSKKLKVVHVKRGVEPKKASSVIKKQNHQIKKDSISVASAKLLLDDASDVLMQSKNQVLPKAWTVQVASFKHSVNATQLVDRLIKKGFAAYYRKQELASGHQLSRVFVGPEIQREKIDQVRQSIKKAFKLNGIIVRYSI